MKVVKILLGMLVIIGVITFFLQSCNSNKDELLSNRVGENKSSFLLLLFSTSHTTVRTVRYTAVL